MEFVFHTMRDRLDLIEQIRGASVHPEDPLVHAASTVLPTDEVRARDEASGRFTPPPPAPPEGPLAIDERVA